VVFFFFVFSKEMSLQDNALSSKEFESMEMHKYLLLSGKEERIKIAF
jgi:hypothetical protein